MTGVQADVLEAREKALDVFFANVKPDKEKAMYCFQTLRDYANKLAYEIAHGEKYENSAEKIASRALKKQEYGDVIKQLYDMTEYFPGVSLGWERVGADKFANDYDRVEVYVGDDQYELP